MVWHIFVWFKESIFVLSPWMLTLETFFIFEVWSEGHGPGKLKADVPEIKKMDGPNEKMDDNQIHDESERPESQN